MPTRPYPPPGEISFIDANILHAHVIAQGAVSVFASGFLEEVSAGTRTAATHANALADAVHKIMFTEAATHFKRPRSGLLSWIQQYQYRIKELTVFKEAADEFAVLPLRLLPVDAGMIATASAVAQRHGLLTGDAIIVALMHAHGIRHLVTNDDDFDGIPGITVWKPR